MAEECEVARPSRANLRPVRCSYGPLASRERSATVTHGGRTSPPTSGRFSGPATALSKLQVTFWI
jgi:hypothetical protein